MTKNMPMAQRFWEKVEKRGPDDCWLWMAAVRKSGHGIFRWQGNQRGAHRIAYLLVCGPIPDDMEVKHCCDNASCVNPAHLELGTKSSNMIDRWERTGHKKQTNNAVQWTRRAKCWQSSVKDRLLCRIVVNATNECWEWRDYTAGDGYGRLNAYGEFVLAHRAAYKEFVGPIPDGLFVLHNCDNRKCINPEHLRLGTAMDNNQDMWARGRAPTTEQRALFRRAVGEEQGQTKLTEQAVREIRAGVLKPMEAMARFGITRSAYYHVLYRTTWKHVV